MNFLYNRKQYVKINGFLSEQKPVKTGVSHGTVLGPVLFKTYINKLTKI